MQQSQNAENAKAKELEGHLKLLEEQWERFRTAQEAVELECGVDFLAVEEEARIQVEAWYITAYANCHELLSTLTAESAASTPLDVSQQVSVSRTPTQVPLPKIELPTFSGDSTEWLSFHDSFKSLIDSNTNLSDAQRLKYLRTCLKGEALGVINNFKISNANYAEAWDLLKSRYQVLRVIVEKHLGALFAVEAAREDSAEAIKMVIDPVLQHARALEALDRAVRFWDDVLVHLVVSKLAYETRKQWELSLQSSEVPTFEQLQQFLETRCRSLEMVCTNIYSSAKPHNKGITKRGHATALHAEASKPRSPLRGGEEKSCLYCNNVHKIYKCVGFQQLDASAKLNFIKQRGACLNCLSTGHYEAKCRSSSDCRICHRRHHTSLHDACGTRVYNVPAGTTAVETTQPRDGYINPASPIATTSSHHSVSKSTFVLNATPTAMVEERVILLATAEIRIQDHSGCWQYARALFDNGSHASFVSERCFQRLRLPKRSFSVMVSGIGAAQGAKSRDETTITLASRSAGRAFEINALVLNKITSDLPTAPVKSSWPHLQDLDLADPNFGRPGAIDILIGVDEMSKFLLTEFRKGESGTPMAQSTVFGWVLFGATKQAPRHCALISSLHCKLELDQAVSRFWGLEELPRKRFFTPEEAYCESNFTETHKHKSDGRFIVEFPLKSDVILGESKETAVRSFVRLEKRLAANASLRESYVAFMQELLDLDHMEPVLTDSPKCFYLPHHPVIKDTSTTTKLRVVFNASIKSSSGNSLNDALMVGPQLQEDLFSVLSRFRTHRYAMTADIAKMYRQVCVSEDCANYQRIVWRSHPEAPLQEYRLLRVTYGLAAASHLALRALQETGSEFSSTLPLASQIVQRDFYMDDLLTGSSSQQVLLTLHKNISHILESGGFELRKWATNCEELALNFPQEACQGTHYLAEEDEVRTLGIIWHTTGDYMSFAVNLRDPPKFLSKRAFLADSSTLFDPLGLLAPCTIKAKIWLQQIWIAGVDWDQLVPRAIAEQWLKHRQSLKLLTSLKINRWLGIGQKASNTDLHIFVDASEKAYASVMYARTTSTDGAINITLVAARTRVAPLKTTSLPRLELCAAHLAAKLFRLVAASFDVSAYPVYAWSDSKVTLAWIQGHPSRWTTFVANRVADIQDVLPPECWHHVRTECNPADCASRGVSPSELLQNQLWWQGPTWLKSAECSWRHEPSLQQTTMLEQRKQNATVHAAISDEGWDIFRQYSTYSKLKRVTAYVLRFYHNLRHPVRRTGPLACRETAEAENALIKYTQGLYFSNDIFVLRRGKGQLSARSSLLRLQPFLDENEVLRAGGRLKHANVPTYVKHPIILPKNCLHAKLIINDIHILTLHAGPQIMTATLQQRYWVIAGRNLVRKIYRNCVKCTRLNHQPLRQAMADLPESRVTYASCFLRSAVDYAGPYPYKLAPGRGSKALKGYICSFICMVTGAMHLEFVGDLTAVSTLNAFKRFTNRRGTCQHIYSDNGTNFVGANKELQRMFDKCMADKSVSQYFADSHITWHFNPPRAPHMGGYWEAGIKRVKYHLKRAVGEVLLTFEEFSTLLTEVEACVNSRPLCTNSSDVGDFEVMTPGHFMVGSPLRTLPQPELREFRGSLGQRWQLMSAMREHFWRRWRNEYLVSLQRRSKWFQKHPNLQKDDIVVIHEDNIPPTKWKLARVLECAPGADQLVRVVSLKTEGGNCVRPICKLVRLPVSDDVFTTS